MSTHAPILVVDDEPMLRRVVARELRGEYVIIDCDDGAEAIAKLRASPAIAAVITDLDMPPGPSGIEVLEEARRRHPEALRILMSGRALPEDVEHAIQDGLILRFLQKPWASGQLAKAVKDGPAAAAVAREEARLATEVESPDWFDPRVAWRLCQNHGLDTGPALDVLEEAARRVIASPARVAYPHALVVMTVHELAAEHHRRAAAGTPFR